MGLWKTMNKALSAVHDVAVGNIGPKVGKAINKTLNDVAPKAIDAAAGAANKTIHGAKKAVGKIKNGDLNKAVGKVSKTILTDDTARSYKIGTKNHGIEWSNKFTVLDQLNSTAKDTLDKAAGIADIMTKDKIMGNHVKNPFQILKKDDGNLIGWQANTRGKLLAGAVALGAGVPVAGKQFAKNRQGTNMDTQPVTSAPSIPAYANNGGATGDLVFALNNLRHGGMM